MVPKRKAVSVKFLSLPLFMLTRNQIKQTKLKELRNYVKTQYTLSKKCIHKDFESATSQHFQRIAGKDGLFSISKKHDLKLAMKRIPKPTNKNWQLPPNLYDVNKIPYEERRGIGGAYWTKSHTHRSKSRPYVQQHRADFYNLTENSIKISTSCNRIKGHFLSNARECRATTRCMINCVATCYRNSSEPGPSTYNPVFTNKIFKKNLDLPCPHLFYHSSSVPQKKNAIHNSHTSFTAAPGRYETRYPKSCPCPQRFIYYPQIRLLIDKENRYKFRNLPYEEIRARNYASPDWRHVKGRGFRYLFKVAKPAKQTTKSQNNINIFPDSKYIGLINNPSRTPLSFRSGTILSLKPRIRFNCIPKKITRRHLRINKKTAFNSCQERFQESIHLPIITLKQQGKPKQTLPLERQLRDHPVMCKRPSEISSKLAEIPKHMLSSYVPSLRKKMFKFQPLPQSNVLVTGNETNAKAVNYEGFYLRSLETKQFLKSDVNTST